MLRVLLLVFLLLVLMPAGTSKRSRSGKYRLCPHQSLPMEESFFMVPQLRKVTRKVTNSPRSRHTLLSTEVTCPASANGGYSCPWYYRLNYDPDRQPGFVVEAACRCASCLHSELGKCRAHMVPRTVLRRRPGFSCWSWSVESFAVACLCHQISKVHSDV